MPVTLLETFSPNLFSPISTDFCFLDAKTLAQRTKQPVVLPLTQVTAQVRPCQLRSVCSLHPPPPSYSMLMYVTKCSVSRVGVIRTCDFGLWLPVVPYLEPYEF